MSLRSGLPRIGGTSKQASGPSVRARGSRPTNLLPRSVPASYRDGVQPGPENPVVVEADVVVDPPVSAPLSGRAPPIVMCMAPLDPTSSVYVADPPSSSLDDGGYPRSIPSGPPEVDSRSYAREVMNLSVDLDHHDDAHKEEDAIDMMNYSTGLGDSIEDDEEPLEVVPQMSEARALARQLLAGGMDLPAYIGERMHWMIVTIPDQLVAGEEAIILFNRLQSEVLRERPRIQLQYAFNAWELQAEGGGNFKADMSPAPMPRDGSDFWWARIKVPEQAFELNFVICDAEQAYENNGGQDFMYPVIEGLTFEQWQGHMAEIARQKELEREEAERQREAEEIRERLAQAEAERRAQQEAEARQQEELRKQDANRGKQRADDLARAYQGLQAKGATSARKVESDKNSPWLWVTSPSTPKAGGVMKLYYNRKASPLHWINVPADQKLNLSWGVNGWQGAQQVGMTRCTVPPAKSLPRKKASKEAKAADAQNAADAEWWEADLALPFQAVCVDFVVNYYEHYDNNNRKDYAVKVGLPEELTYDQWLAELAEVFRVQEFETRVAAEQEARQKEMRRQEKRKKAQEAVMAVERRKVRHVLHTEPEKIQAGKQVTIWYNPTYTNLAGREQIFLTCGFNRWTHKAPVGPLAMVAPDLPPSLDEYGNEIFPGTTRSGSPTHWKATFTVPHDAYKMDFVFSDVPGGDGEYDNRGGYDYHLPVDGSPVKEPSLYVCHIAVEMAPIAKVGGLGDVVTALGRAVKEQGHLVEVIIPKYEFFNYSPLLNGQLRFETEFDWGGTRVVVTTAVVENLRVWFVEPRNGFFNTQTVYGRYDDEVRFDFFCKAAMEFLLRTGRQPDILHCHDWSTAHVAKSYWEDYNPYGLWKPKVVFTIHNLNYGQKKLSEAAWYCQKFTTVSPTYAFETGGTPIIAPHVHKFCGIRNGIDPDIWDPENNIFLPAPITSENVVEGKAAARAELRKRLNLTSWNDKFIVAVVSRLTPQKGVHLIKHTAYRTVDRGGQFVLLGSAPDPKVQADFNALAGTMGGQDAAFCFKYDEPLSHLIYAAADMIVVPSMFEPCGLTQMIAMRYGAVPIVRHTGGLKDTVFDVDYDKERAAWELHGSSDWQRDQLDETNGFAFEGTDPGALDYALNRAIDAWYNDRAWFHGLQQRIMDQDWTWNRPGLDYIELYFAAIKQ